MKAKADSLKGGRYSPRKKGKVPARSRRQKIGAQGRSGVAAGHVETEEAKGFVESVFARLANFRELRRVRLVPESVFVFNGHAAAEAGLQQACEKRWPVDEALAGKAVAPPVLAVDADLLK